jgi:hypothetical protein
MATEEEAAFGPEEIGRNGRKASKDRSRHSQLQENEGKLRSYCRGNKGEAPTVPTAAEIF